MKKQYIHILALALGASMLMVACAKEEQVIEEPQNEKTPTLITESLTATKEGDATKVGMTSGRVFTWNTADQAAFTINDGGYSFAVSENYNGAFTVSYSGTRMGYAVIPSRFVKDGETVTGSYDGTDLTVCYPDNYDISGDVEGATPCYDNADGTHFIPFPMVAKSVSGNKSLTFYSIGALVRVQMNNIPAGTKNVYVTFNQTVTGTFPVSNLTSLEPEGTNEPKAEITGDKLTTPSTVTIKVSNRAEGLAANRNITLYIPVPTTTNLKIASSTKKMSTVARNGGYAWAVNAITCTGDGSFATTLGKYVMAPGNLLAQKTDGKIKFSFLSGTNQLISTRGGNLVNQPHDNTDNVNVPVSDLNSLGDNRYQDMFTWEQMSALVGNETIPGLDYFNIHDTYSFSPNKITVNEVTTWKVPNKLIWKALTNIPDGMGSGGETLPHDPDYYRTGDMAIVGLHQGVAIAKVLVDVSENDDYSAFARWYGVDHTFTTVPGWLLFPDGYIDQTDVVLLVDKGGYGTDWGWGDTKKPNDTNRPKMIISYNSFEKMVNAGALFLSAAVGVYAGGWVYEGVINNGCAGYYMDDTAYRSKPEATSLSYSGLNVASGSLARNAGRSWSFYSAVRLVREVTP